MSKAYLVWTGCYSDKAVVAVCTTQERADAIVKWILDHDGEGRTRAEAEALSVDWFCADSDARVSEVDLDVAVPGSDGRVPYSVGFDANGNVTGVGRNSSSNANVWLDPPAVWGPWHDGRMSVSVRATDPTHAVKIAVDLRAARLALGGKS